VVAIKQKLTLELALIYFLSRINFVADSFPPDLCYFPTDVHGLLLGCMYGKPSLSPMLIYVPVLAHYSRSTTSLSHGDFVFSICSYSKNSFKGECCCCCCEAFPKFANPCGFCCCCSCEVFPKLARPCCCCGGWCCCCNCCWICDDPKCAGKGVIVLLLLLLIWMHRRGTCSSKGFPTAIVLWWLLLRWLLCGRFKTSKQVYRGWRWRRSFFFLSLHTCIGS